MKIGVFDSGKGGLNILEVLKSNFPEFEFVYISDEKNMPYGLKSGEIARDLTTKAIGPLVDDCEIIVIACNTATTSAIDHLRAKYPHTKFIGLEPMIRPAAKLTKTGAICVCATPATLHSQNYAQLKKKYAKNIQVVEPDCSTWAELIENGNDDKIPLESVKTVFTDISGRTVLPDFRCDVLVLGCTHYHILKSRLQKLFSNIKILEPSDAIVERVKNLL